MNNLDKTRFLIRVNRLRLGHAILNKDTDLIRRSMSLLTHLHADLFEQIEMGSPMSHVETNYLVFSEVYQDGIVLTKVQYRQLQREMSKEDRATHVAVEVDGGVSSDVEQVLLLDKTEVKNKAG